MTTPKPDLMNCPFCGSRPVRPFCYRKTQGEKWGAVVCGNCESYGPEVRTGYGDPEAMDGWGKDADVEWNRRAAPAPAPSDRERAERLAMKDCPACGGRGETYPWCPSCDDSTEDHVCPDPVKCKTCDEKGEILDGPFAERLALEFAAVREEATKAERERCIAVLTGIASALKAVEPAASKAIADAARQLSDVPCAAAIRRGP